MTIECDLSKYKLIPQVDRSKVVTHGKPALGKIFLRLHMYRCITDVHACRSYYEELSEVDGEYLEWRRIVLAKKEPKWLFIQADISPEGIKRPSESMSRPIQVSSRAE